MISVQLDLFEDVVDLPWYGRAPRSFTRSAVALFLRQEPQKDERFFVDPDQLDLWRRPKRPRKKYSGALLLKEV